MTEEQNWENENCEILIKYSLIGAVEFKDLIIRYWRLGIKIRR